MVGQFFVAYVGKHQHRGEFDLCVPCHCIHNPYKRLDVFGTWLSNFYQTKAQQYHAHSIEVNTSVPTSQQLFQSFMYQYGFPHPSFRNVFVPWIVVVAQATMWQFRCCHISRRHGWDESSKVSEAYSKSRDVIVTLFIDPNCVWQQSELPHSEWPGVGCSTIISCGVL